MSYVCVCLTQVAEPIGNVVNEGVSIPEDSIRQMDDINDNTSGELNFNNSPSGLVSKIEFTFLLD